ncbi:MAG: hypothetical protein HY319_11010 [Armatimonadetes bacterium]|nr:hypothetical protein [Armatimonadota bacterium]
MLRIFFKSMRWRLVSIWVNLLAFVLLVSSLAVIYVWPEHLAAFRMPARMAPVLVLQIISFVLLLASCQASVPRGWRVVSLAAAFVVLGESTAMVWLE